MRYSPLIYGQLGSLDLVEFANAYPHTIFRRGDMEGRGWEPMVVVVPKADAVFMHVDEFPANSILGNSGIKEGPGAQSPGPSPSCTSSQEVGFIECDSTGRSSYLSLYLSVPYLLLAP